MSYVACEYTGARASDAPPRRATRKLRQRVVVEALGEALAVHEATRGEHAVREEEAVGADHRDVVGGRVVRGHVVGQRGRERGGARALPHRDTPGHRDHERRGPAGALGDQVGQRSVDLDLVGRCDGAGGHPARRRAATCRPLVPVEVHVARHTPNLDFGVAQPSDLMFEWRENPVGA